MAVAEGAIAILSSAAENHSGTVFVLQAGPFKKSDPANFLDIAIGLEDYNMIIRLLRSNTPVKLDVDVKTKFQSTDTKGYNVIAEIPGVDKNLKDEVVMLGAHLDSWPAATGATDNAACALFIVKRYLTRDRIACDEIIKIGARTCVRARGEIIAAVQCAVNRRAFAA